MKNLDKNSQPLPNITSPHSASESMLEDFFIHSLQEMYYVENSISAEFALIKDQISSAKLKDILKTHYAIHLRHKDRLVKIFELRDEFIENKKSEIFDALISEGKRHLAIFPNDIVNWEIALILVSQKLSHYKIASYGGLAHVAIKLNYYKAATLLAISVQEEEEFIANNLNGIFDAFLASHVAGYRN